MFGGSKKKEEAKAGAAGDVAAKQKEIDSLKKQVEEKDSTIRTLNTDIEGHIESLSKLSVELTTKGVKIDELTAEKKKLEAISQRHSKQTQDMQKLLDDKDKLVSNLKKLKDNLQLSLEMKEDELDELKESMANGGRKSSSDGGPASIEEAVETIEALKHEKSMLQTSKEALEEELSSAQDSLQDLEKEIKKLRDNSGSASSSSSSSTESAAAAAALEEAQSLKRAADKQLSQLGKECDALKLKQEELQKAIELRDKRLREIEVELKAAQDSSRALTHQLQQSQTQLHEREAEVTALQHTVKKQEKQLDDLEDEIKVKGDSGGDMLRDEIEALKRDVSTRNASIATLERDVATLHEQVEEKKGEAQKLTRELDEEKKQRTRTEKSLEELKQQQKGSAAAAAAERDASKPTPASPGNSGVGKSVDMAKLTEERDALAKQVKEQGTSLQELQQSHTMLEQNVQTKHDELQSVEKELDEKLRAIEQLKQTIEKQRVLLVEAEKAKAATAAAATTPTGGNRSNNGSRKNSATVPLPPLPNGKRPSATAAANDKELEQVRAELEQSKNELENSKLEVEELTNRVNAQNRIRETLEEELKKAKEKDATSAATPRKVPPPLPQAETQQLQLLRIRDLEKQLSEAQQQNTTHEQTIGSIRSDLQRSNSLRSLSPAGTKATAASAEKEKEALKQKVDSLQRELVSRDGLVETMEHTTQALNAQLTEQTHKLSATDKQVKGLQAQIETNEKQIKDLREQLSSAEKQLSGLQKEHESSLASLTAQHNEALQAREQQIDTLRQQLAQLEQEQERLRAVALSTAAGADAGEGNAIQEELRLQVQLLQQQLHEKEAKIESDKLRIVQFITKVEDEHKAEIDGLKAEIQRLQQGVGDIERVRDQLSQLEQAHHELTASHSQLQTANGKPDHSQLVKQLQDKNESQRKYIAELEQSASEAKATLENEQAESRNDKDNREELIRGLHRTIDELRSSQDSQSDKIRQLTTALTAASAPRPKSRANEEANAEVEEAVSQYKKQLNTQATLIETHMRSINELQTAMRKAQVDRESVANSHHSEKESLQKELNSHSSQVATLSTQLLELRTQLDGKVQEVLKLDKLVKATSVSSTASPTTSSRPSTPSSASSIASLTSSTHSTVSQSSMGSAASGHSLNWTGPGSENNGRLLEDLSRANASMEMSNKQVLSLANENDLLKQQLRRVQMSASSGGSLMGNPMQLNFSLNDKERENYIMLQTTFSTLQRDLMQREMGIKQLEHQNAMLHDQLLRQSKDLTASLSVTQADDQATIRAQASRIASLTASITDVQTRYTRRMHELEAMVAELRDERENSPLAKKLESLHAKYEEVLRQVESAQVTVKAQKASIQRLQLQIDDAQTRLTQQKTFELQLEQQVQQKQSKLELLQQELSETHDEFDLFRVGTKSMIEGLEKEKNTAHDVAEKAKLDVVRAAKEQNEAMANLSARIAELDGTRQNQLLEIERLTKDRTVLQSLIQRQGTRVKELESLLDSYRNTLAEMKGVVEENKALSGTIDNIKKEAMLRSKEHDRVLDEAMERALEQGRKDGRSEALADVEERRLRRERDRDSRLGDMIRDELEQRDRQERDRERSAEKQILRMKQEATASVLASAAGITDHQPIYGSPHPHYPANGTNGAPYDSTLPLPSSLMHTHPHGPTHASASRLPRASPPPVTSEAVNGVRSHSRHSGKQQAHNNLLSTRSMPATMDPFDDSEAVGHTLTSPAHPKRLDFPTSSNPPPVSHSSASYDLANGIASYPSKEPPATAERGGSSGGGVAIRVSRDILEGAGSPSLPRLERAPASYSPPQRDAHYNGPVSTRHNATTPHSHRRKNSLSSSSSTEVTSKRWHVFKNGQR